MVTQDSESQEVSQGSCAQFGKIDIHCHTTRRPLSDLAISSASIDVILREMEAYGVERTILLATYFPHKRSGISNFRLARWIDGHPALSMFGSLDFEHYFNQGFNELEELAEEGIVKGVKVYTCYQNIDLHGEDMGRLVQLCARQSLPLMFHGGESYNAWRTTGNRYVSKVATPSELEFLAKETDLKIIISHLCEPYVEELCDVVKRNYNMYSDSSGLFDSRHGRENIPGCIDDLKRFLGECGPAKLLFGTDFPVQTHKDSIFMIEEAMRGYSSLDKRRVYHDNAVEVLR